MAMDLPRVLGLSLVFSADRALSKWIPDARRFDRERLLALPGSEKPFGVPICRERKGATEADEARLFRGLTVALKKMLHGLSGA
jgi:hypothetical protein